MAIKSTTLTLSLVQAPLFWEDKDANLKAFADRIASIEQRTDLVVLPEMFTTGFTMNAKQVAEPLEGPTLKWMQDIARQHQIALTGSFVVEEKGCFYNRLVWVDAEGQYLTYDKRHLFSLAKEHLYYSRGKEKIFPVIKGWKCLPLICYDLRFPVWSRNVEGYDLLLYVANWPAKRSHAWKSLLVARAIENQCYTVGLNRTGEDANGIYYSGDSKVVDYAGETLREVNHDARTITVQLDYNAQLEFRMKYRFLADIGFCQVLYAF